MQNHRDTLSVKEYYDSIAGNYYNKYKKDNLYNTSEAYPANYFRMHLLLNSFIEKNIKKIVEVGVGEGTPLSILSKTGLDVWGFDISEEMVKLAKKNAEDCGINPEHIFCADIQDPITYSHILKDGKFDGILAMGVMPHVHDEGSVIKNMATMLDHGGTAFVEFRNKLFSLFSFNNYTIDFIVNDLLQSVDENVKDLVKDHLESKLQVEKRTGINKEKEEYDKILSKFHNPLEVADLFEKNNFCDVNIKWYHYHPAMPCLYDKCKEMFRSEAIKMESNNSTWKSMFLCSAFVVEATRK